jgi:16S rRNA A1518/A1519 N6-dimethyltransferase RsmA/KsgA/DIM1 with predicted DNA glycosylase/AP lyase activity
MLKNNIANGLHTSATEVEDVIKRVGFNAKIRPQDLSVDDWLKLFGEFGKNML